MILYCSRDDYVRLTLIIHRSFAKTKLKSVLIFGFRRSRLRPILIERQNWSAKLTPPNFFSGPSVLIGKKLLEKQS